MTPKVGGTGWTPTCLSSMEFRQLTGRPPFPVSTRERSKRGKIQPIHFVLRTLWLISFLAG
jgi:hypothetical protein